MGGGALLAAGGREAGRDPSLGILESLLLGAPLPPLAAAEVPEEAPVSTDSDLRRLVKGLRVCGEAAKSEAVKWLSPSPRDAYSSALKLALRLATAAAVDTAAAKTNKCIMLLLPVSGVAAAAATQQQRLGLRSL